MGSLGVAMFGPLLHAVTGSKLDGPSKKVQGEGGSTALVLIQKQGQSCNRSSDERIESISVMIGSVVTHGAEHHLVRRQERRQEECKPDSITASCLLEDTWAR